MQHASPIIDANLFGYAVLSIIVINVSTDAFT